MGDLGTLDADREAFNERHLSVYGAEAPRWPMGTDISMLFQFVHQIASGDIAVYRSHVDHRLHLGVVRGPYEYDPSRNDEYHRYRPVRLNVLVTSRPGAFRKRHARP